MTNYLVKNGAPALILAPMEGITDAPMRRFLTTFQPWSFCVSEFIRVSHTVPPEHVITKYVPELLAGSQTTSGTIVIPQILGGDPDRMAQTAEKLIRLGAIGVDINFGCPAPTVNRHDGGATLLKYPERIYSIIKAVRAAVPKTHSVSAKLRLGWDDPTAIIRNAYQATKAGASWITIHGRTKMQGYTPPAFWKPIGEVRKEIAIPVVANGEIWKRSDFLKCREETSAEHFMIGRSALANPLFPKEIHQMLFNISESSRSDLNWQRLLSGFASASINANERQVVARIKQWLNLAFKHGDFKEFDLIKRETNLESMLGKV